jgi:hypothetical protein
MLGDGVDGWQGGQPWVRPRSHKLYHTKAFIVLLIMVTQFAGIRGKVCWIFVSMPVKNVAHIGTLAYYLLLCSTQLPVHQRMNANGDWYQMIYFPDTNNTMKHDSCYGYTV